MAKVKLSQESYDELLKDIETLKNKENKLNEIIAELRNKNTDLKIKSELYHNACKNWIKSCEELYKDYMELETKGKALDEINKFIDVEFEEYEGLAITDLYDGGILYAIEKIADIIDEFKEEQ